MQAPAVNPAAGLVEELTAANSLLKLLEQEQACLVEGDVEGLSRLTGEKSGLVAKMTELARRRHRTLAAGGFTADESGMKAWLETAGGSHASWTALLDTAQKAKELNRTNGLMIGQQMARNQAALNILQGNQQGSAIYGPNGQSAASSGSRRLVIG
jgi:flagella synthesis protein FlgN